MVTVWKPDTDDCQIHVSDGEFMVWFEDGRTDPADKGFRTLEEAEDFVANDPRAKGRPHRIENVGAAPGEPLRFVKGKESKVHATAQDVVDECRTKNFICTEVERIAPGATYKWRINPDDRMVEIEMEGATRTLKDRVKDEMVESTQMRGRSLDLKAKARIL